MLWKRMTMMMMMMMLALNRPPTITAHHPRPTRSKHRGVPTWRHILRWWILHISWAATWRDLPEHLVETDREKKLKVWEFWNKFFASRDGGFAGLNGSNIFSVLFRTVLFKLSIYVSKMVLVLGFRTLTEAFSTLVLFNFGFAKYLFNWVLSEIMKLPIKNVSILMSRMGKGKSLCFAIKILPTSDCFLACETIINININRLGIS